MRGGLVIDNTGVWGGDLLVCTTGGYVYRINKLGNSTLLYKHPSVVHMEGIYPIPNDPKYNRLAGSILVGLQYNKQILIYFKSTRILN